jgi:SAM-dependent methyltransferase
MNALKLLRFNYLRPFVTRKIYAFGNKKFCYICRRYSGKFCKFRKGLQSFSDHVRRLKVVGSDVENYSCPHCGCNDRERHLVMFFDKLKLWDKTKGKKILHFAPEKHFSEKILSYAPSLYVKADLFPRKRGIQKIDVTCIPYEENHFDVIICNHVLEHVYEDSVALSELFRVLNPSGFAILQTPYSVVLENSYQDPSINTDELRNNFYGQEDHVRVYGRDLFEKIKEAGFKLHIKRHSEVLPDIDPGFFGVNPDEDLVYVEK